MYDVSVIVPVYNNEKYIRKCIRSLQEQTLSNMEIIVVNDGSTDHSAAIVKEMQRKDQRIVLIEQENRGVSVARNRGVRHAKGRYITFVDGDDYVSADYLKCMHSCAVLYRSEMVIAGITMVDEEGRLIREILPAQYSRFKHEEWPMRISAAAAHLYDRAFWCRHSIAFFPGERGEDIPPALYCAAMCGSIAVTDQPGYYYVQHSGSAMTSLRGLKQYSIPYRGMEEMIRRIRKEGPVNSRAFHELFVLRILATFLFVLGPGSKWDKMKALCEYIYSILEKYYPEYYRNPYIKLTAKTDFPFKEKMAVRLLVFLVRHRLLTAVSGLMCMRSL